MALVGVLRGPLFGLSDRELFAYRRLAAGSASSRTIGDATALRTSRAWPRALATLRSWYPLDARAARGGRARAHPRATPATSRSRRRRPAASRRATCSTPSIACAGRRATAALWPTRPRRSRRISRRSSDVESLPLEPGRTDVVRLMNLHKAKGLEARSCSWPIRCGGFAPRVDVRIVRDGADARGYFSRRATGAERSIRATAARASPRDGSVTMPRSRRISTPRRTAAVRRRHARAGPARRRPLRRTSGSSRAWGSARAVPRARRRSCRFPTRSARSEVARVDCLDMARRRCRSRRAHAARRATEPSWSITSVTAEARHIAKMTRAEDAGALTIRRGSSVPDTPSHRADAGIAWGTLDPRPARTRDAAQARDARRPPPAGDVADDGGAEAARR